MAKDALTVLREARELISDPKRWTTGFFAKDADGRDVWWDYSGAVCWCAIGALNKVAGAPEPHTAARKALRIGSERAFGETDPTLVNDGLGHVAVLRMFDAAIAFAEKEAEQ